MSPVALVLAAAAVAAPQERAPTYHRDVEPIMLASCARCHQREGSAPFPLTTYEEVRARAEAIVRATATRFMPPWLPAPGYVDFADDRRLSDEAIATLEAWARAGSPEGDPGDAPPPPPLGSGWRLGEPDLVVEFEGTYSVPPDGQDVYRNFVLPLPLEKSVFVRAIELRPGRAGVVHHARILVDRTGASRRLDARDAEPGYDGMLVDAAEFPDGVFLGWAPGKVPHEGGDAFVWQADPGMDLVLQLHMMPKGYPQELRPEVGLYFTDEPPHERAAVLQLGSRTIDLPPGARHQVVEDSYVLPADVTALGVYPHAHYLCREMQAYATLPDGSERWLLEIPSWDFYWQDEYRYERPVPLPEGTQVTMRYVYDNSAENPQNPNRPPKRVRWGPRSSDEMGDLLLMVVPRDPEELEALREDFRKNEVRQEIEGYEKMLAEPDPADEAELRHELAFGLHELGRTEEAIAEWRRAVALRPGFAEAYYNLAGALASEGRLDEAEDAYEAAIENKPRYAEACNNLGVLLHSQGRLDEAIANYRRAIEARPEYAFAEHNLGSALLAMGRVEESIGHLERALALEPDYAQAHYTLASALARTGRLEEEIAHYRAALASRPDYPEALNNLGGVLTETGRAAEALEPLRRAVALRPDYVLAHRNLGRALAEAGALDEAAAEYRTVLSLAPEDAEAHLGLAAALRRAGKLAQALSHYHLAVRTRPTDVEALSGLAWALAVLPDDEVRNPRTAVRLATRAVELAPESAEALDALAAAHAAAGRFRDAVREAERALAAALEAGASERAEAIRGRLELYRRGSPFVER